MAELGVPLEAKAVHTGRSARNHLLSLAQTNGISSKRVDAVMDLVGLRAVTGTRAGGYSAARRHLRARPTTVTVDRVRRDVRVRSSAARLRRLAAAPRRRLTPQQSLAGSRPQQTVESFIAIHLSGVGSSPRRAPRRLGSAGSVGFWWIGGC
jgi:hypothetical protein